jgi:NAD(P)-dependent dehydrogenase (short-subunit alcohol dehydrogenase family)
VAATTLLGREFLPSMRVDGLCAVVTGAGRGIGRGSARALAAAGADVVLVSRTGHELVEVAGEVERLGRKAWPVVCDVTDRAAVDRAIDTLERLDVLVNAAGANIPEPFLAVTEEHFDRLVAVNVKATFFVAQTAARRMIAAGAGGSIINLSSQMGRVGARDRSVYCSTKHAVEGLTRALAVELAPAQIRVNAIAPTFVRTPMTEPFLANGAFLADTLGRIPLGRVGEVADVVGAVVFLASPAAALVTGESLLVDGGWTAQ